MKTLKDYFDKIYIINYIEAPKRRENIIKQLKYYNFEDGVEFSYGMPFTKIKSIGPHFQEIANEIIWNVGRISGVACALNHYTAIKTAYELGANSVLILEDDIIFRDNRDLIIEYLDNIPKEWNYLYFTPAFNRNTINVKDLNIFLNSKDNWINLKNFVIGQKIQNINSGANGFISSGAYALDKIGMKLYITIFENSSIQNSDMLEFFFHNIENSPLNSYTTKNRLFAVSNELNNLTIKNNQYLANFIDIVPNSIEANTDNFKFTIDNEEKTIIWKQN